MDFEWKGLKGSFDEVAFEQALKGSEAEMAARAFSTEGTVWTKW